MRPARPPALAPCAPLLQPVRAGTPRSWRAAARAGPAAARGPRDARGDGAASAALRAGILGAAAGAARAGPRQRGARRRCGGEAAAQPADGAQPAEGAQPRAEPLQLVSIDLETNSVVLNEEALLRVQGELRRTGVQKLAIVGVIGAFRTGKSFLLDLMLRYLRHDRADPPEGEACAVPDWVLKRQVPPWAVQCGNSLIEGRAGSGTEERRGFLWRPGMEKCTEGIWVWSEAFVRRAGDEDVAVLLMDTQGAWDAQMTKEQSATVFGLTTLATSRLVYNVARQIQQDKIDNLLYFTDFAQAALRAQGTRTPGAEPARPFQTLEFLVRDWPHYPEGVSVEEGRRMMTSHLEQYSPGRAESATSMDSLRGLFQEVDVWCLPHPSLRIERQSWDGDLEVVEPRFWRFLDGYLERIFSPAGLRAKTSLGAAVTVETFPGVLREFIGAFRGAAPQAQTFAEAMQTSTSLLARDSAMQVLRRALREEGLEGDAALAPDAFEELAARAAGLAEAEFGSRALFGTEAGIRRVGDALKREVAEELQRRREENERRLEASLSGLTNISLAAVAAFGVDRVSDFACDWWAQLCRDVSGDLAIGYTGVLLYVLYSLFNVQRERGELGATVAALELGKSMAKRAKSILSPGEPEGPAA